MVIKIENEMLATYVDFTRFRQIRRIGSAAGAEKEFELQDIKRLYGTIARIGDASWQECFLRFIFCQFIETQKEKGWTSLLSYSVGRLSS